MNVVLVMFRENGERRSFSLTRDVTVIGRREDAHFRIPLTDVSRKHCRLVKDGNTLLVEDLGSSNGTYHNGQRVQEAEIHPGDTLRIGPVQFLVQIDGVPADEDLGGQSGSGLADSAATMVTPAFTAPPGIAPPPPLPPGFSTPVSDSQPTIDETPLELGDDDVLADDFAIESEEADAEAEADLDVPVESSFVTSEAPAAAEDDDLIIEDDAPAADEVVEAGEAEETPAAEELAIPSDIVLDEQEIGETELPEPEELPDFDVSPPAQPSVEEPAAETPPPANISAETLPIEDAPDELSLEEPEDEAAPAAPAAGYEAEAEEPALESEEAEAGEFDVMHDSSAEEEDDDVLIDFDLPDDPKKK